MIVDSSIMQYVTKISWHYSIGILEEKQFYDYVNFMQFSTSPNQFLQIWV
jgi:hypothetical protein